MTPEKDKHPPEEARDLPPEDDPTAGGHGTNVPITGIPNPNVPITGAPEQ